jgi:hypothetical protein
MSPGGRIGRGASGGDVVVDAARTIRAAMGAVEVAVGVWACWMGCGGLLCFE